MHLDFGNHALGDEQVFSKLKNPKTYLANHNNNNNNRLTAFVLGQPV